MLEAVKNRIRLSFARRDWRKKNRDNYTVMGNDFNPKLVHAGIGSYGMLNVVNHSANYTLRIGNYCSIATNVSFVVCGEHRLDTVSTYPFKARYLGEKYEAFSKGNIVVDDDVWICENSTILSGVHIMQGAVVAAGSVVTKDVPAYSVVAGNPARVIKYRFSEGMIKELLNIDYSKLDEKMIAEHTKELYEELTDVEQLNWMPRKQ